VNLCLRVIGRRTDGYHLLDSIFAAIDLCDRIIVSVEAPADDATSEIVVRCDAPGVPADGTNLAARAATALLKECGVAARVIIEIDKRIPAGAGLGGGSSNAATVLRALADLLDLAIEPGRLHGLALALGADVPFFLTGGSARVRGIGEQIEPIAGWPELTLAVVVPPVAVATAWAFRAYPPDRLRHGPEAEWLAAGHPLDGRTRRRRRTGNRSRVRPAIRRRNPRPPRPYRSRRPFRRLTGSRSAPNIRRFRSDGGDPATAPAGS
jgi:4-diphosphocytidyl-2-C-methyl-D-erythritol kinase